MMSTVEEVGGKIYTVFPTIDTNIPSNMLIDTTTLLNLLFPFQNDMTDYIRQRTGNMNRGDMRKHGWLKNNIHLIWDLFFKVKENKQIFHGINFVNGLPVFNNNDNVPVYCDNSQYTFHHQIKTNGVAISITLVKNQAAHQLHPHNPPTARGRRDPQDVYIHQLTEQQIQELNGKKIIAIDPNMRDLLYCVNHSIKNIPAPAPPPPPPPDGPGGADGPGGPGGPAVPDVAAPGAPFGVRQEKMRYTADQRRKEKKSKNNRKSMIYEKRSTLVNNRNIEQHESDLSAHNSNTIDFDRYLAFVLAKNTCNTNTRVFYQNILYRKRRFKTYINTQKSESKLIKNLKKKFGGPDTTLIAIGDWNEGNRHRKFHEPVIGIGLRKILRKAGYKVLLVDEFRTSRMCNHCQEEDGVCEKFRRVKNPRPYRGGNITCNGLLRCRTCKRLWNRDLNAAINIYNIAFNALNYHPRPFYLQRPNQQNQNENGIAVD